MIQCCLLVAVGLLLLFSSGILPSFFYLHVHFLELCNLVPKQTNISALTPFERRTYSTSAVEPLLRKGSSKADQVGKRGLVQRLSLGFEQLEANARDSEIQLGMEGR